MSDVPIIDPNARAQTDPQDVKDAMEEVVIELTNFNAMILDYAVQAAKTIVQKHLVALSPNDQGPDGSPGADTHPATATFAVALFNEITDAMRNGSKKLPAGAPRSPLQLPPGVFPEGEFPSDYVRSVDDPSLETSFETSIAKGVDNPGQHDDEAPDLP